MRYQILVKYLIKYATLRYLIMVIYIMKLRTLRYNVFFCNLIYMIHPINIITQIGVRTSPAHHRTDFGLVLAAHITHLLTFSSHLFVEDFGFYLRCHFIKSYQLSLWIYLLHKELSMFNVIMTILIKIIQYLYNDKCSSLHWGQGRALGPAERFLLGRQRWNNTSTLSHFWSFMLEHFHTIKHTYYFYNYNFDIFTLSYFHTFFPHSFFYTSLQGSSPFHNVTLSNLNVVYHVSKKSTEYQNYVQYFGLWGWCEFWLS